MELNREEPAASNTGSWSDTDSWSRRGQNLANIHHLAIFFSCGTWASHLTEHQDQTRTFWNHDITLCHYRTTRHCTTQGITRISLCQPMWAIAVFPPWLLSPFSGLACWRADSLRCSTIGSPTCPDNTQWGMGPTSTDPLQNSHPKPMIWNLNMKVPTPSY